MSSRGSKGSDGGSGCAVIVGIVLVIAAVLWLLSSIGHLLGLTPTFDELTDRPDGWVSQHYSGVFVGYALTVAVIVVVLAGVWLAIAASSGDPPQSQRAREWLTRLGYAAVGLLLMVVVLPIGPKSPGSREATPSNQATDVGASPEEPRPDRSAEAARERRREKRRARERQRRRRELRKQRREAEAARRAAAATPTDSGSTSSDCASGYDPCVPPYPPDLDCSDLNGPYVVTGDDPHGLDADHDGRGCE
jgi:hypothetical protein